jgi:hypothetical protein
MCKTNVETKIYYVSKCKNEHEKNMTRLWCKINVERTKKNERSYFYLYPSRPLALKNFQKGFYVCIE